MKIKPRGSRVLIEVDDSPHTFAGGELLIARTPDRDGYYKMFPRRGTVVEIGPEVEDCCIGDRIVCTKYHGVDLPERQFDGHKLLLVREEHVLFIELGGEIQYGVAHTEGPKPKDRSDRQAMRDG